MSLRGMVVATLAQSLLAASLASSAQQGLTIRQPVLVPLSECGVIDTIEFLCHSLSRR